MTSVINMAYTQIIKSLKEVSESDASKKLEFKAWRRACTLHLNKFLAFSPYSSSRGTSQSGIRYHSGKIHTCIYRAMIRRDSNTTCPESTGDLSTWEMSAVHVTYDSSRFRVLCLIRTTMPKASKNNYYAVCVGRDGPKIYNSWDEVSNEYSRLNIN
jgi:viroplasmin and RNaseH domain-containing protein